MNILKTKNLELKDLLQQVKRELIEFYAPEKSPKEKEIEHLKHLLEMNYEEDEKENIRTFIAALEDGLLNGHEGRLAVFHKGSMIGATFKSESAFLSFEPLNDGNSYTLLAVPGGEMRVATAYNSHQIQVTNFPDPTYFSELQVPVEFIHNGIPIGSPFIYEVDTGASDTSCPCVYELKSQENVNKGYTYSIVKFNYKTLAFWGSQHLACHKRLNLRQKLADGSSIEVEKLVFQKSQLHVKIGDCDPVEVTSLILPTTKHEVSKKILDKDLGIVPNPPPHNFPLLLGRDLIFKRFSTSSEKELRQNAVFRLDNRRDITPPSSPNPNISDKLQDGIDTLRTSVDQLGETIGVTWETIQNNISTFPKIFRKNK